MTGWKVMNTLFFLLEGTTNTYTDMHRYTRIYRCTYTYGITCSLMLKQDVSDLQERTLPPDVYAFQDTSLHGVVEWE